MLVLLRKTLRFRLLGGGVCDRFVCVVLDVKLVEKCADVNLWLTVIVQVPNPECSSLECVNVRILLTQVTMKSNVDLARWMSTEAECEQWH